ncbi:MAG TPA: S-layer protein domain-containing protein [Candidatus Methanoperedens sp.]|nr:S-layer protein domain-containing protein [Candidatus Methanoperedens sp.]
MSKKILTVALVLLMIIMISLPANAAVTTTKVEIRGSVANASTLAANGSVAWNYANFAGFWYDLKTNQSTESLAVQAFNGARSIDKEKLWYNTTIAATKFKVASEKSRDVEYGLDANGANPTSTGAQYYDVVGWMAEKYIGINGKPNKLAKLILEQDTSDKKTLTVGETWEMGGGYSLTAQSIDARSNPRLAWFVLSKDGAKLDDKVLEAASTTAGNGTQGVYTYFANLGGESNVPIFVTYIDSVFSGASSDMVQLKYTWLIDNTITEVKSGDKFGIFKVDSESPLKLKSDSAVSLSKDSTVTLAGNMNFRVSDSADTDVRFYPKLDYVITGGNDTKPGNTTTVKGTARPTTNVTSNITAVVPTIPPTVVPTGSETKPAASPTSVPGFEVTFAIAGLLAVAYIVLRQRK